ncbi:MAG: hypothetical protein IJ876_06610 [Elusimicrobiaceae bacterium]|nr:hypothetical protein [Elusimicrobiaceae bacterium]
MRKWAAFIFFLWPVYGWGQSSAELDPNIQVSTAVTSPTSSVDLLKQSAQKNSPFAAPASNKPPRIPKAPRPTVPSTTAPAAGANTLDIPLTVGGSSATVQATVVPAVTPKVSKSKSAMPTTSSTQTAAVTESAENTEEEDAADAELEYAVKMLEESKQQAQSGRAIPPSAAKNKPTKVPAANKAFNPNAFRPGVEWLQSKSTHFDIYTQKPNGSIGSANMAMTFETAYDTLRRFIPWMMSGRVRVFVYQDHNSYLRYEPNAKAWTRAVAYPTRGEIVVYDEPGKTQELKEVFAHELTHIFTQQFFDKYKTGRIMTPTWLDEGLAVLVEDQMFTGSRGGPWDHDYRTLRFERDPKTMPAKFTSNTMFGGFKPKPFTPISQRGKANGPRRGKPVRLAAFDDFMQEGSLDAAEGKDRVQNWYLQAYLMVRFLLNPAGGMSPSNRMQFEQFTRLVAQGEAVRDASTGFLVKDVRGKQVYEPYSVEKALGRAYRYGNTSSFEDNFWKWLDK